MASLDNFSAPTRWGINAIILLGMILALWLGRSIFIPTVISLLLAAMLYPPVTWLNRPGVPIVLLTLRSRFPWIVPCVFRIRFSWNLSSLIVVLGFVLLSLVIVAGFGVAITKFVIDMGSEHKQRDVYLSFRDKIERISPVPLDPTYFNRDPDKSEVFKKAQDFLKADNPNFKSVLTFILSLGGEVAWQSILIMFVLLFLLMEGPMLSRRIVEIFGPSIAVQSKVIDALQDMAWQLRNYLIWRTIINFAMGLVLGVLYYMAGLSQPWTWALLVSVLFYVPYLGPILAGVPAILDAFIFCPDPWWAFGLLVFYIFVVTIEGYFIVPLVMGRSMEMNATTVMIACLFWELVWGSAGLFLAMPLMAAVRTICLHVPDMEPWANLMGTHEPRVDSAKLRVTDYLGDTAIMKSPDISAYTTAAVSNGMDDEITEERVRAEER